MKKLNFLFGLIIILPIIFSGVFISQTYAQDKYAILVSAEPEPNIDDMDYHSEFWYDLFIIYQMLIEKGFAHDNIYVLFGEGNDFASNHNEFQTAVVFPSVAQITDYPNHKNDVQNIFTWLSDGNATEGIQQIQSGDFLFFWWMGHGAGCVCTDYEAIIHHDDGTQERITDNEFEAYFAQLPACVIKVRYMMTCRSGGIIQEFEGLHSTVHASAECCQNCYIHQTECHAEFNYHLFNALREIDPDGNPIASDDNGDGWVSIEETNHYVNINTTQSNTQISDYRNIGPIINIDIAQPDANVRIDGVYSRDFAGDDGYEPSDYLSHIWYEGPDLWVRHADDGLTNPQDPEFGQTNYVYARVHNIGCATINANADLSWCEISAWSNPASWNPIASLPVNNLESSETRVISAPWSTVPVPGKYCLHTVLDAPGDPPNASGIAYMDNNKVQINIAIENNVPGWTKNFHWLIENGLDELAKVDLVVEKLKSMGLLDPPKLSLEIPHDLKFNRLIGAELKDTLENKIIELSPKTRKVVLQGVVLEPNQKIEAVLSVVTSNKMKLGENVIVKVSEQIKGREMGGIILNIRVASQKQVMSTLFRRVGNLFKMLDEEFNVSGAEEISKLCQEVKRDCRLENPNNYIQAITEVGMLESKSTEDISKLMKKEEFDKFEKALQTTRLAIEKENLDLFVQSQEEMIFSTKPLFLRKMIR